MCFRLCFRLVSFTLFFFILVCRVMCLVSVCVFGRLYLCLVVSCVGNLYVCAMFESRRSLLGRIHYYHRKQCISLDRIHRVCDARGLG